MKLFRDPLFHFILLGAALLGAYALVTGLSSNGTERRVEIGASEVELLVGAFERQWGRQPTPEERQRLVDARVREEILYREALAVGLDRNDVVVRRRMVQKMELLTQDLALLADPTDEELRAFLAENLEEFRIPPRISFNHVYFNVDRRDAPEDDARDLLAELRRATPQPARAPESGDPIMIENDYERVTPSEVSRTFGERFAEALFALGPGWHGPVLSGYGLHLVHVGERVESRAPEFAEVRDRLVLEFNRERRTRAMDNLYDGLASRYEIVVD